MGSSSYVPPTDPSIVFQNIRSAFAEKNVVNYLKAFPDTGFAFIPTSNAQSLYADIFRNWSKVNEEQYFLSLCNRSTPTLEWLSLQERTRTSSSVLYEATYKISGLPSGSTASGKMNVTLVTTIAQLWVIERWIDYETVGTYTWSTLKATYVQ